MSPSRTGIVVILAVVALGDPAVLAQDRSSQPVHGLAPLRGESSYLPVDQDPSFDAIHKKHAPAKEKKMQEHRALLQQRYDLSNRPVKGVTMTRGKVVQGGVRVKMAAGATLAKLASMTPDEIRKQGLWPKGFLPLSHPIHEEGGMIFPAFHIKEIRRQEGRDLERFDIDFDLPDHLLPEFPPAIFLTTRPDLGDVSSGELVTIQNFYRLFNGVLTPKQLDGVRLLVTPFPQQQFNLTNDRRSAKPGQGVSCFDCHVNGHTNAATHLVQDQRPQPFRRRLDTPSLRGVNQQRLFGSQRALKTVEDFTEFEQRAAYFDGDPVIATKKGINVLDRGAQVHPMAELQELLDFPPAPRLDLFGRLVPGLASAEELRGEKVFFGKGRCSECHMPPIFSDNFMHDLKAERFFDPVLTGGRMAWKDGPIKTFPLRGIKESPPYLHDGRLLTLDDTVEFFNLILGVKLTDEEKADLVTYLYTL